MINYKLLDDSLDFYENKGFKRIEAPWTVSEQVSAITRPKEVDVLFQLKHNDKCLVASGEQSFLYLILKGHLPPGKYQTITPCFRYEAFDTTHTKYFMKNELIRTDIVDRDHLNDIVNDAHMFFSKYLPFSDIKIENTDIGYDITFHGEELGSYGIRECDFVKWIYATGCAEPRMSTLMKKYGIPFSRN